MHHPIVITVTAFPSRIRRLVARHQRIDNLIRAYPSCPRQVSREVDRLLVEVEAEIRYFLDQ